LPFVTLVGIFIVVAAAFGFGCLEAAVAGVRTSRGTCSGFSANFHVTFNIHFYIKKQQFLRQHSKIIHFFGFLRAREEKKENKKRENQFFMLFRMEEKQNNMEIYRLMEEKKRKNQKRFFFSSFHIQKLKR
jgi:hypothetical protein